MRNPRRPSGPPHSPQAHPALEIAAATMVAGVACWAVPIGLWIAVTDDGRGGTSFGLACLAAGLAGLRCAERFARGRATVLHLAFSLALLSSFGPTDEWRQGIAVEWNVEPQVLLVMLTLLWWNVSFVHYRRRRRGSPAAARPSLSV